MASQAAAPDHLRRSSAGWQVGPRRSYATVTVTVRDPVRDLVLMGAYREGADPAVDRAMALHPALSAFVQQEITEVTAPGEAVAELQALFADTPP